MLIFFIGLIVAVAAGYLVFSLTHSEIP